MKTETYNKHETYGVVGAYSLKDQPPIGDDIPAFKFRDAKHTPYNKRVGEVDSHSELRIVNRPDGSNRVEETGMTAPAKGWLEVQLTEHTTINGRTQSRTISVGLHHDARKALLEFLLKGE